MALACSLNAAPAPTAALPRRRRGQCHCKASGTGRPAVIRQRQQQQQGGYDLVLSSGFLAFAAHAGFLQAVEEVGLPVNGLMGTSAGALVGSLWAAGYSPKEIAAEFTRMAPAEYLGLSLGRGKGLLTLQPVVAELGKLVPRNFEDLPRGPFGVGVVDRRGRHRLLSSGPLPEAVVASAAIPVVFSRMPVPGAPGGPFMDGGMRCRIGLDLWRSRRYGAGSSGGGGGEGAGPMAAPPAVVHLISRSSPFSGNDNCAELVNATVVRSKKSSKNFWNANGDFQNQFMTARDRALPLLEQVMEQRQQQQWSSVVASPLPPQQPPQQAGGVRRRAANCVPPSPPGAPPRPSLAVASALPKKAANARVQ